MIKLWGYIGFVHAMGLLGFVCWGFIENSGNYDDAFLVIMGVVTLAAGIMATYNVLVLPLLKFRPYKAIDSLDEYLAQDMEVGDKILKPSGLAKVLGTLSLLVLICILLSASIAAYELVESNSYSGSWRSEEVLIFIACTGLIVTGIFEFLFTIRTINTKRIGLEVEIEE